ncbi:MAG: adenosylcobinamide-GDP ribazoletransferase [Alphaproteobacteria bacterium]|nr:adenosylcobinamide-GDP ribazoletransferase [Alphaproteobacteria bacterium]
MVKSHKSPYPLAPAGWRGWVFDLHFAASFLTRLPLPALPRVADGGLTRAMRLFPLIGLLIGLVGGGVYAGAVWLGLPPSLAALVSVAATAGLTGGLHEDGLADTADGFGAPVGRVRKMEIMRDSRIGAFGVLALVFSVGLRAGAIAALADPHAVLPALAVAGALSRAAMPLTMRLCDPARRDGLGASAGHADDESAFISTVIAVGSAIALALIAFRPAPAVSSVALTFAAVAAVTAMARVQIGGYTGDVLGAVGQAVEAVVLLTLVVTLS